VPVSRALSSLACRRLPTGANWIHEIKHDGFRLMARRDPVGIRLITRGGHDWSARYPLVVEAVNHLKVRSCLIDGEVVCCDEKGVAAFQLLRHRRNEPQACLYAFDLLELDGTDPSQTACPHMTHGQRRFLMHTHTARQSQCPRARSAAMRGGAAVAWALRGHPRWSCRLAAELLRLADGSYTGTGPPGGTLGN